MAGIAAHAAKDEGLSPPLTGMSLSIPWGVDREALPKKYEAHFISVEQCKEAPMFNEKFVQVIINAHKPDKKSPWFSSFNRQSGMHGLPRTYLQVCGMDPVSATSLVCSNKQ